MQELTPEENYLKTALSSLETKRLELQPDYAIYEPGNVVLYLGLQNSKTKLNWIRFLSKLELIPSEEEAALYTLELGDDFELYRQSLSQETIQVRYNLQDFIAKIIVDDRGKRRSNTVAASKLMDNFLEEFHKFNAAVKRDDKGNLVEAPEFPPDLKHTLLTEFYLLAERAMSMVLAQRALNHYFNLNQVQFDKYQLTDPNKDDLVRANLPCFLDGITKTIDRGTWLNFLADLDVISAETKKNAFKVPLTDGLVNLINHFKDQTIPNTLSSLVSASGATLRTAGKLMTALVKKGEDYATELRSDKPSNLVQSNPYFKIRARAEYFILFKSAIDFAKEKENHNIKPGK